MGQKHDNTDLVPVEEGKKHHAGLVLLVPRIRERFDPWCCAGQKHIADLVRLEPRDRPIIHSSNLETPGIVEDVILHLVQDTQITRFLCIETRVVEYLML